MEFKSISFLAWKLSHIYVRVLDPSLVSTFLNHTSFTDELSLF